MMTPLTTALVAGCLVLTSLSAWKRQRVWLRRTTVLYLLLVALQFVIFALTNIARFGVSPEFQTIRDQAPDDYRAGLLVAQEVAYRYLPLGVLVYTCLAVLALFPLERRPVE